MHLITLTIIKEKPYYRLSTLNTQNIYKLNSIPINAIDIDADIK